MIKWDTTDTELAGALVDLHKGLDTLLGSEPTKNSAKSNTWNDVFEEDVYADIVECPHCKRSDLVLPFGSDSAKVVLIAGAPDKDEINATRPFASKSGGILRSELTRLGHSLSEFLIANLWIHEQTKSKECHEYSVSQLIKTIKTRKAVILFGADACKTFAGVSSDDVSGLRITSKILPANILVYGCVKPDSVFAQGVGEFRESLTKIIRELEKENLL